MATIIFKATEACNSNCVYCDVVHRKKPATISIELLTTVYQRIDEYLKSSPEDRMRLTWHGGEPCMAGKEFYRTALRLEKELCPDTRKRIDYILQSNLTLLDDEFIDIFQQMRIEHIGTSFECVPGIRGIGTERDSEKYNRLFLNALSLLEKRGIRWGFIYVVTKQVVDKPKEIFYHLTNLSLEGNFVFHPVVCSPLSATESKKSLLTAQEYAHFLGKIFKEWWPRRHRFPNVEPFARYLRAYQGQDIPAICEFSENCGLHVYIGPDGHTSQCGRSADWDILEYGNISEKSLMEILMDSKREPLNSRAALLSETDCKHCKYWELCHGGCPLDAFNTTGDFTAKTGLCDSVRLFLSEYFEPITNLTLPTTND